MMHRGLGRQLFVWFTGSVTIPLVLLAVVASVLFSSQLQATRVRDVSSALTPTAQRIENSLAELDRISFAPYLHSDLFTLLVYADRGHLESTPRSLEGAVARAERTYTNTLVKMMFTAEQTIRSITFFPEHGTVAYRLDRVRPGLQPVETGSYRSASWYVDAATEGRSIWVLEGKERVVRAATTIQDRDRKRQVGVLVVEADADELLRGLAELEVQHGDRLVLADASGKVIAGPEGRWDEDDPDFIPVAVEVPSVDWRLVYQVSKAGSRTSSTLLTAIAVGVALLTAAVAYLIYRRESRTVVAGTTDILATLTEMRDGNLNRRSSIASNDWLGTIAASVNHLGAELSTRIEREYKAVIEKQNAEYRALQAQISPHFLYNVLNDFMAMNRLGQHERLEESILRLTRLLRYSCSTAELATVGHEVDFAREYLYLRQIQLDDRLRYQIDVDESCREVEMPRLIIQPHVENAIKHGLPEDRPLTIELRVRTSQDGTATLVTIRDDGLGFDADRITDTTGFATMNIRERLRLLARGAELEIESRPREGTTCVLALPSEMLC
jgi:two-component system sensor histidine kinase YesM